VDRGGSGNRWTKKVKVLCWRCSRFLGYETVPIDYPCSIVWDDCERHGLKHLPESEGERK